MTYKKIVEGMVGLEAERYITQLLEKNGIDYKWTDSHVDSMKIDDDTCYWTVRVGITGLDYHTKYVVVGGTVDDMLGVCTSVVWTPDKKKVLWFTVESTREFFKIKKFEI